MWVELLTWDGFSMFPCPYLLPSFFYEDLCRRVLCFYSLFLYSYIFFILFQTVPPSDRIKIRRYFSHTETATLHAVKVYCLYLLQTAESGRFGMCGKEAVHAHLLTYILLPLVTVSYWDGTEWLNSRKWSTLFLLAAIEAAFSRPFRILPKPPNSFMVQDSQQTHFDSLHHIRITKLPVQYQSQAQK